MKLKSFFTGGWRVSHILGLVGLVFGLVGLILTGCSVSFNQEAQRLEQLPILTAKTLADSQPDQEGLIEGRISERNPVQFRTFVAYIREVYQGEECAKDSDGYERCEARWVQDERVTPPLWLDVAGGRVQLVNADYSLANLPVTWQSTLDLKARQTQRYSGLAMGNPVFAAGKVVRAAEGLAFKATLLGGGDSATYIARQRGAARFIFWLGLGFISLGSLFMLVMGYDLFKQGQQGYNKVSASVAGSKRKK